MSSKLTTWDVFVDSMDFFAGEVATDVAETVMVHPFISIYIGVFIWIAGIVTAKVLIGGQLKLHKDKIYHQNSQIDELHKQISDLQSSVVASDETLEDEELSISFLPIDASEDRGEFFDSGVDDCLFVDDDSEIFESLSLNEILGDEEEDLLDEDAELSFDEEWKRMFSDETKPSKNSSETIFDLKEHVDNSFDLVIGIINQNFENFGQDVCCNCGGISNEWTVAKAIRYIDAQLAPVEKKVSIVSIQAKSRFHGLSPLDIFKQSEKSMKPYGLYIYASFDNKESEAMDEDNLFTVKEIRDRISS